MPDSEEMKNDEQKCQAAEASGSAAINCASPSLENHDQDSLERARSFMLDGWVAASPPKFVSLEEIIKAAKGMQNMALAHEIAVDKNFKIDKLEPEDDTLHKKVKEIMHKVFWDILANELSQEPPVFTQALRLLGEIKESLDELLLPHNARLKETINQVLDVDLIKQQAENGVLDFSHYSQYVTSIMAKICAPVRDEKIEEIKRCTDVIDTFKGIMEVLQLMKLDLANFTINMIRPNIVASSIEYEKKKFAEFLKIQTDGLFYTKKWLLQHLNQEVINSATTDINSVKKITHSLLAEAYLDLLEFDSSPNAETLMLDQGRLLDLRNKTSRLAITGSILLLLKPLSCSLTDPCKQEIKEHILVLLNTTVSNKDLEEVMPNILVQVKADIMKASPNLSNVADIPEQNVLSILENQMIKLPKPEHKIRELVTSRIRHFLRNIIVSQTAAPQQIPPGLSPLQKELTDVAAQFAILFSHNRSVFGEYYQDIVGTAINEKKSSYNNARATETNS
ncbi:T-complex protein 11-like protein 1 [Copidosoma floridanum]|uniref:T-complex protein 11-like protein 1 n=1 Tax=Copidosoma floridanum TaxID=29053 RepID=UPI0006C9C022|nr:T-complex protein 11-like protein 1 [Copidosoma floridanum]XP_014218568.1 T-complex protein 11-like protein 1 [Copidosoma floridanum]